LAWNKHGDFNVTGSTVSIFWIEIVFEIVIEIGKPRSAMQKIVIEIVVEISKPCTTMQKIMIEIMIKIIS